MPDPVGSPAALTIRVAYPDLPEALGIEARLVVGDWSGSALLFTEPRALAGAALGLERWLARPAGPFTLEAGGPTEQGGHLGLRWSVLDGSPALACLVQIRSLAESPRPGGVRRLSLELLTRPEAVARFARELHELVTTRAGVAGLAAS